MTTQTTEELRDSTGKLTAYRVTVYDEQGRRFTSDVDVNQPGIAASEVVQEVISQMVTQVKAKTAAPGLIIAPTAVSAIAVQLKAKKGK